jgi:hypothetical protein
MFGAVPTWSKGKARQIFPSLLKKKDRVTMNTHQQPVARRRRVRIPLTAMAVTLLPLSVAAQGTAAGVDEVTFATDVAPILAENCQLCHQPGSIGPMSLMTYEQVRPWAPMIRQQVVSQEMPPYHYDTDVGIQELKGDWRLSPEDIRTIVRWVDAGAPQGDPMAYQPRTDWPEPGEWQLAREFGPPNHVIPSTPYTVPATGQDIWYRPLVESGITEDRCIRAIEVKPSVAGRSATHHANSNFQVRGDDGSLQRSSMLTEYALGKIGEIIPADACRVAPANSLVSWDIHYYPSGERVEDDVVEIGLWFHDAADEPAYRQTLAQYNLHDHLGERLGPGTERDMVIPPHEVMVTQGFHTFDTPVRIDSFQPHGHLRLAAKALEIFYPETGRRELVSMISNWNPGWHHSHVYEDHVAPLVPTGAVLIVTAWHDNTANNRFNPDPDQWVSRGSRTTDEMSHAWIAITHLDQEGYERLLAEREESDDRIASQNH